MQSDAPTGTDGPSATFPGRLSSVESFLHLPFLVTLETSLHDPPGSTPIREVGDTEAGDLPLLQPVVTDIDEAEERYRHAHWTADRDALLSVLSRTPGQGARERRVLSCGGYAQIYISRSDGSVHVLGRKCHDRWCRPCAAARSLIIAHNLESLCTRSPTTLLTLTLKHSSDPVRTQIRRLLSAFASLRKMACWKRRVFAGAWFIECKISERSQQWHIHLHAVIKAKFFSWLILRDLWLHHTKDSYRVKIETARIGQKGVLYAPKYSAKGFENSIYQSPSAIAVLLGALRSVRLFGTFGEWQGYRLGRNHNPPPDATHYGSLIETIDAAKRGSGADLRVLDALGSERAQHLLGVESDVYAAMVSECNRREHNNSPAV